MKIFLTMRVEMMDLFSGSLRCHVSNGTRAMAITAAIALGMITATAGCGGVDDETPDTVEEAMEFQRTQAEAIQEKREAEQARHRKRMKTDALELAGCYSLEKGEAPVMRVTIEKSERTETLVYKMTYRADPSGMWPQPEVGTLRSDYNAAVAVGDKAAQRIETFLSGGYPESLLKSAPGTTLEGVQSASGYFLYLSGAGRSYYPLYEVSCP